MFAHFSVGRVNEAGQWVGRLNGAETLPVLVTDSLACAGAAVEKVARIVSVFFLVLTVSCVVWSSASGGIVALLLEHSHSPAGQVLVLQSFWEKWQWAAPLGYLLFVTIEVVVAPLPGTLLYLPGGVIFGGFLGGFLALLGNVCGAGISCQLMRSLVGRRATAAFYERKKLTKYRDMLERRGLLLVVLLRVNPLTSSDLVSYAAGLTNLRVGTVMLGTCLGMAPLCFAQAYLAGTIFVAFPWLIWPLLAACLAYVVIFVVVIWRLRTD